MLTKFWEKIGEGVASEWNSKTLTPAIAFWGGVVICWVWKNGWDKLNRIIINIDLITGVALIISGVFILAISSSLVQWLTLPMLKVTEGYWPYWLWWLRGMITNRINRKVAEKEKEWSKLAESFNTRKLDGKELEKYILLDADLSNFPLDMNKRKPTILGNILSAAEEYPETAYGLEIGVTWPRLWLIMPENMQNEINEIRQALNYGAQLFIWGGAFVIFTIWAWWAALITFFIMVITYSRMKALADVYGQIIRSSYDLHRFAIYKSMHWPIPSDPYSEVTVGQSLTLFLKRNILPSEMEYIHPKDE